MKKKLFLIFLILLLSSSAVVVYRLLKPEAPPEIPTALVSRADIEEKVLATGTLSAFKTVEVGAQVSGQLEKLHVELGDEVKKGELLAEIDPVLQQNALKDAQAEQENVEAQIDAKQTLLQQYRQTYQRQQQMFAGEATSRADLEAAEAQYRSTEAELRALQSQLKKARIAVATAEANLGYTRISAPMGGVIISLDADEGQTLVSSQTASTILTIANLDRMTIKAEISEADVTEVISGQTVYFSILGEPEKKRYATLRTIEPGPVEESTSSSSSNAVYYNGLFEVDNLDRTLRVGMTAEVTIIKASAEQALVAPVAVLKKSRGDVADVELMINGKPEPRQVRVGLNDKIMVQLLDGVDEGDRLVLQQLEVTTSLDNSNSRPGPPGRRP